MTESYDVAEACPADNETIVNIVNADRLYESVIPAEYYKEPFLTLDELETYLSKMDLTFFVCRAKASAVGVGALIVRKDGDGQLGWVFVLPEKQRVGVGSALVSRLEEHARKRGVSRMILETDGGAHWAISFYSKLGYKEYKRTDQPWGDQVWMEKSLLSPHLKTD